MSRTLAMAAAAASIVASIPARAEDKGSTTPEQKAQTPAHQAVPCNHGQPDADPHAPPCPRPEATAQPPTLSPAQREPGGPALKKANAAADSTADRINRAIVGDAQQNENNAAAANPRAAEMRENGGEQKRAAARPAAGAASMQGGVTSMQPGSETGPQQEPTVPPPTGLERTVRDATLSTDKPGRYNPFALELSPLGLFLGGRLSFNAEWAPAVHHAIVVSPYITHTSVNIATSGSTTESQTFTGVGGEIGYRYYTGHKGMNGVFVGPSLIGGIYNAGLPNGNQPFTNIGVAVDVGLQQIFWNHIVVGGGLGLEYLSVSHDFADLPTSPSIIAESGVKPRFLLEAGYAF
ncbi:MAG TPA: hypothetical protein VGL81_21310 [Polyangiaceae bacterium]